MSTDPATLLRIAELRNKCQAGTATQEEYREVIQIMRAGRSGVTQPTAGSRARKTAAAAKPNGDDLLSELDNL
jgi:hypothetical protein